MVTVVSIDRLSDGLSCASAFARVNRLRCPALLEVWVEAKGARSHAAANWTIDGTRLGALSQRASAKLQATDDFRSEHAGPYVAAWRCASGRGQYPGKLRHQVLDAVDLVSRRALHRRRLRRERPGRGG